MTDNWRAEVNQLVLNLVKCIVVTIGDENISDVIQAEIMDMVMVHGQDFIHIHIFSHSLTHPVCPGS